MKSERAYLIFKGKSVKVRVLLVGLLVVLLAAWAFAASTAEAQRQAAAQKVFNFKMQTLQIAVDPLHGVYAKRFVDRVKKASNGEVDIKLFAVNDVVPMFGMFDAVREGTLDLMLAYGGWWGGKIGDIAELEVGAPAGFLRPVENDIYFYEAGFADMLRSVYRKHGIHYIGLVSGGSASVFVKKPIAKASDLRGVKIMESGIEARYYAELGATAVKIMPMGEIYTAMATGVVDGAGWAGPRQMSRSLKLHEVAKFVFWPPTLLETRLQIVMNLSKWEALPDRLKQVLEDSVKLFSLEHRMFMYKEDFEVLEELQTKHGVKLVAVTPEERARAAKAIRDEFAKKSPECARAIEIERKLLTLFGY